MKILIAGYPEHTKNYEKALLRCQVSFETNLSPKDPASYDKLLLPGGGDIHPSYFGQTDQGSLEMDQALDKAQFALLDVFVQMERPILGICRGMQLVNVYFGGTIIQHLATYHVHQSNKKDQLHLVKNAPGSLLHGLYGNSCVVNSAHHQGCGQIGHGLQSTQISPDQVVEALEHENLPVLGVQWHPERIHKSAPYDSLADGDRLIQYFADYL